MVAVTATWQIPYAQSFDPFCDGAEITQAMAERVDELLDAQDVALRAFQRPAYASISVTTPQNTVSFRILYDTTDEDTAGLVDLSFDPYSIYPNQAGIWVSGVIAATSAAAAGATEFWSVSRQYDLTTISQDQSIREDTSARSASALAAGQVFDPDDDRYRHDSLYVPSGVVPPTTPVFKARFWAWRYSDLA